MLRRVVCLDDFLTSGERLCCAPTGVNGPCCIMKNYIYPSNEMLLTVIDGKVCEGSISGVKMVAVDGVVEADSYRFSHNGTDYVLPITQSFYKSERDFRENRAIEKCCASSFLHVVFNAGTQDSLWYYDKGKAIEYKWREQQLEWFIEPNYKVRLVSGFVPSELYYDQEDVYAWNDLIVHKDNGDIEIKEAPCKVLMLNDKQKELFERFKALLAEMNEAKMMMLEERDNCEFIMYNRENYDISVDYEEEYAPCFPKDMRFIWSNYTYFHRDNGERMSLVKR